jgi:hypothetical protein
MRDARDATSEAYSCTLNQLPRAPTKQMGPFGGLRYWPLFTLSQSTEVMITR